MSGLALRQNRRDEIKTEIITLTPEMATKLLESNQWNRPLREVHVSTLAQQISEGRWKFNGDTVKVAENGDVLDGQHRCWAVIEANKPIQTLIVYGIARDAFSTIDTLRAPRTGGDVLALAGVARYRSTSATALAWLLRWQRGVIEDWRDPHNKIQNSDIEEAFGSHPGIVRASERVAPLRSVMNASLLAFLFYILSNRNPELAERVLETLENPAGVAVNDPIYRLRVFLTARGTAGKRDPLMTIALSLKAFNAAAKNQKLSALIWRKHGKAPEAFPKLEV